MLKKVRLGDIRPNPFQARKGQDAAAIQSLADEIREVGLWSGALRGRERDGHVELCFGHRRLAAVKRLGWKEVEVDVVPLTDEQMALQGLVENLQREGLNDADKGEGIASYLKLREKSGITDRSVIKDEVCRFLGLSNNRVNELLKVASFSEPVKEEVRHGRIAGITAVEAERVGGEEFVRTVAEKRIPRQTVQEMGQRLREITEPEVRNKVREDIRAGEVTEPEEVVKRARREQSKRHPRPRIPPDLIFIIGNWTVEMVQWTGQLKQVVPELYYIVTQPRIASKFRDATNDLIAVLQQVRHELDAELEMEQRVQERDRHSERMEQTMEAPLRMLEEIRRQQEAQSRLRDSERAQARKVLGLAEGYTRADLYAAYRAKARERHPDRSGGDAAMAELNAAYVLLTT
jgi:ParB family chromosome partitioning protein